MTRLSSFIKKQRHYTKAESIRIYTKQCRKNWVASVTEYLKIRQYLKKKITCLNFYRGQDLKYERI